MNRSEFNILGHELIAQSPIFTGDDDFICKRCNIRIAIVSRDSQEELKLVINCNDNDVGQYVDDSCILACEEQQIKKLLE